MRSRKAPTVCPSCGNSLPEQLDQRSQIVEMIRTQNLSYKQIGWVFDVSTKTVYDVARAAGINRKPGGNRKYSPTPEKPRHTCSNCRAFLPDRKTNMAADVAKFVRANPTIELIEVAVRFGLHIRSVMRYMRRAGVRRRKLKRVNA